MTKRGGPRLKRAGLRVVQEGDVRAEGLNTEQILAAMATKLSAARTVPESDALQLGALHAQLKPRASFICRFDPTREQLQITAARGRSDERVVATSATEGPVGVAFSNQRIARERDLIAVPFLDLEGPAGCLVLLGLKAPLADESLRAIAAQVSAGAEAARMREEMARRTKDLETAVAGLRTLEKNREELLSNVSHDLKNPLTTLKTYLAMLGQGNLGAINDKQTRAIEICDRNVDRLLRMINDLLLVSRLEAGDMQLGKPFGLKALAAERVARARDAARQQGVEILFERSSEVFIQGDRERIAEAVSNLIENAVHASPAGGKVSVRVAPQRSGVALLSVSDGATGAKQEDLDRAFDSLYRGGRGPRGRRAGAELALPVAAKIVRLHGGRVAARANGEKGSTLEIYLPSYAHALASPSAPSAQSDGLILLIEDDQDCREVLHHALEDQGYRVMSAGTCQNALAVLAEHKPALVLLDLRLSDGDGRSVLHHIRSTAGLAKVPVYIVSGASDAAEIAARKDADRVDGFLEKPLQLAKLLDTVGSIVGPSVRTGSGE